MWYKILLLLKFAKLRCCDLSTTPITFTVGGFLNNKQNITQAAPLLFADHVFNRTTTLQITKNAGAPKLLLFYYLKGMILNFTEV